MDMVHQIFPFSANYNTTFFIFSGDIKGNDQQIYRTQTLTTAGVFKGINL